MPFRRYEPWCVTTIVGTSDTSAHRARRASREFKLAKSALVYTAKMSTTVTRDAGVSGRDPNESVRLLTMSSDVEKGHGNRRIWEDARLT